MAGPILSNSDNRVRFIPYWSWNRLESRPRRRELKTALQTELYDGLWMLGRQWQLGEFKGNDTGSGILARTSMDYFNITGIGPIGSPVTPYQQELPIEAIVEPIVPVWSLKERLLIGQKWLRILNQQLPATASFTVYKNVFLNDADFNLKEQPLNIGTSETEIFDILKTASKPGVNAFLNSCKKQGISLDGTQIYFILASSSWATDLATRFPTLNASAVATDLVTARNVFLAWLQKQYNLDEAGKYWNRDSLDYRFKTEWQAVSGPAAILESNVYQNKSLDWYSVSQTNVLGSYKEPNNKTRQIIMTQSRFPGMPSSRWWEMEDGNVNFCEVNADTTDIAKILATQFALVYQDDWFVIPYKVPVGSYSSVKGIVVTDVFGITTFISNYDVSDYTASGGFEVSDDWADWRWMDISARTAPGATIQNESSGALAVLPVIHRQQQSDPIEEIVFARDEVADLVWAIEKVVPDELGKGMDGFRLSNVFLEKLKQFRPSVAVDSAQNSAAAPLDYKLMDATVPENCIPFIPVHMPNSNRSTRFQRAAMPRILENYSDSLVRPTTSFLKGTSAGYQPYYINEEELSRAGVTVQTRNQRTRWYNGKTICWTNYELGNGRGSHTMNLEYDSLKARQDATTSTETPSTSPVTGALAWWRADDPLNAIVGSKFDQLHDGSGNQNHLVAPSSATRPAVIANWKNNKPAIGFNGAEALRLAMLNLPPNTTDFTAFLVGERTSTVNSVQVVLELSDDCNTNAAWAYISDNVSTNYTGSGMDYLVLHNTGYNIHGMPQSLSLQNKAVHVLGINMSDPNPETYIEFQDNEYRDPLDAAFQADNTGIFPSNSFNVGSRGGSSLFAHYNIAELILFPTKLAPNRIRSIKDYLKQKYQLVELPVTGALAWWRADDPRNIIIGSRFDQLHDGSGNQNHLAAPSPTTRPSVISNWKNNKPAIGFDGAEALRLAMLNLPPNTTDFTAFLVGEKTGLSNAIQVILEFSDDCNLHTAWAYIADNVSSNYTNTGLDYLVSHGVGYNIHGMPQQLSLHNKALQVLTINMSDPDPETYIEFNDTQYQVILDNNLLADNNGTFLNNSFNVCARGGNQFYANYNIAEIILFPAKLSSAEIEAVKSYLKARYGL